MENYLRVLLPVYLVAYLGVAFVWRTVATWRKTGQNPYVLTTSDDALGFTSTAFKVILGLIVGVVGLFSASPEAYLWLVPVPWMDADGVRYVGLGLLGISFGWTTLAQWQMGASWRIGIDNDHPAPLVARGLFRVSRNPIFLGMMATLLGVFLVLPNAVSLVVLTCTFVVLSIQIRLEEEFLERLHGDSYRAFKAKVRRWL